MRDESPKDKSPLKNMTVNTNGERKKINKGKRPYNYIITIGELWVKLSSKRTMKRKITEMMVVYYKEGSTSTKIIDHHMLGFKDSEKFGGILNEKNCHRDHCYTWEVVCILDPH